MFLQGIITFSALQTKATRIWLYFWLSVTMTISHVQLVVRSSMERNVNSHYLSKPITHSLPLAVREHHVYTFRWIMIIHPYLTCFTQFVNVNVASLHWRILVVAILEKCKKKSLIIIKVETTIIILLSIIV